MKHSVVVSDLRGEDIRPPILFSKFRELSIEDSRSYFGDPDSLIEVPCPACAHDDPSPVFKNNGFLYNQCRQCRSVYVSPRPSAVALKDYYLHSRASKFRVEHYTRQTGEARRQHVLRSHALWLGRLFDEAASTDCRRYGDMGTNYPLVYNEIRSLELFHTMTSVDPNPDLDSLLSESGITIERGQDITGEPFGAMSAFEQLEHKFSPGDLLRSIHDRLAAGGMLFFTTKTVSGFDLQVLWDKAPYIYVPEHLNLLSIDGITQLLEETGFEVIELSTPGQLDVGLVKATLKEDPSVRLEPFISYLIKHRGADAHEDFQAFLQRHRLSSHLRVAAVKK